MLLNLTEKCNAISCLAFHLQPCWLPGGNYFCYSDCDPTSSWHHGYCKWAFIAGYTVVLASHRRLLISIEFPMHCKWNGRPKRYLQTIPCFTRLTPTQVTNFQFRTCYRNITNCDMMLIVIKFIGYTLLTKESKERWLFLQAGVKHKLRRKRKSVSDSNQIFIISPRKNHPLSIEWVKDSIALWGLITLPIEVHLNACT